MQAKIQRTEILNKSKHTGTGDSKGHLTNSENDPTTDNRKILTKTYKREVINKARVETVRVEQIIKHLALKHQAAMCWEGSVQWFYNSLSCENSFTF